MMPLWNWPLAQVAETVGVGVTVVDGSGRKPDGNGLAVPYETLDPGEGVALPVLTTIHGKPLDGAVTGVLFAAEQPPADNRSSSAARLARRTRTHPLLLNRSDRRAGNLSRSCCGRARGRAWPG